MRALCFLIAVGCLCGVPSWADEKPPNVPPELLPLVSEAKEQFMRGGYAEAEKTYRKMLAASPNNLYILSNLGVVLFRSGNFKPAEEMFQRAITVAPADEFSHCTLGIVYYSQGKYDEAINALTEALAINPRSSVAHNYLGIAASQKGLSGDAVKELTRATLLDASYADAFFNLAVVYATQSPPDRENARKYYERAIDLGAERDDSLEKIIDWKGARRGLPDRGDFLTPLEMERRQLPTAVNR